MADSVKSEIEEVELSCEPFNGVGAVVMISAATIGSGIVAQLIELPRIASGSAPVGSRIQEKISLQTLQAMVVIVQCHFANLLVQSPAFSSQGAIVRDVRSWIGKRGFRIHRGPGLIRVLFLQRTVDV
ncbi:hypothetical protein CEXT_218051 [Caerostris extrusa]|uniref:Uncharacterized protein n=1 Tax=Caerostris extrusa TaxID=172846 RepID=A0AAV4MDG1_CAEEX|nr:hypothetical protein CEXT_218051 [Caerostris extrusa]